jgi:hypothetical protein
LCQRALLGHFLSEKGIRSSKREREKQRPASLTVRQSRAGLACWPLHKGEVSFGGNARSEYPVAKPA